MLSVVAGVVLIILGLVLGGVVTLAARMDAAGRSVRKTVGYQGYFVSFAVIATGTALIVWG